MGVGLRNRGCIGKAAATAMATVFPNVVLITVPGEAATTAIATVFPDVALYNGYRRGGHYGINNGVAGCHP